jgi:uncharacterized protein YcbK (DUF882 family)
MQLSPHFTLEEFVRSDQAVRHGINNDLPAELLDEARRTAEMLERVRAELGVPLLLTSGYRCLPLNALLGSKPDSDHPRAMAADIRPQGLHFIRAAEILSRRVDALGIGQLILEYPDRDGWVHVSTRKPTNPVNRVITITAKGTVSGIQP